MQKESNVQRMFASDKDGKKWNEMYEPGLQTFEKYIFQQRRDFVLAYIERQFDTQASVIDLGCGAAPLTLELLKKGYACTSMDYSMDMIRFAHQRLREHKFDGAGLLQGDSQSLPFTAGSFDCIACVGVISYIPEPDKALEEIRRILHADGKLIITFRNYYNRTLLDPLKLAKYLCLLPVRHFFKKRVEQRRPGAFLKPREVEKLLAQQGFTVEKMIGVGFGPIRFHGRELFADALNIRLDKRLSEFIGRIHNSLKVYTSDVVIMTCRKNKR
ncbi:MAG: class I SAM-dependent methyltransferase [Exilibacterium sp.]